GEASLALRVGGVTGAGTIFIYLDATEIATRTGASPDQNGDGVVNATDVAILKAKLGTNDPTADFDGDGMVTQADLALLEKHLGHSCTSAPTPTRRSTWGTLKETYR